MIPKGINKEAVKTYKKDVFVKLHPHISNAAEIYDAIVPPVVKKKEEKEDK